jgi:hypothetical protein
LIRNKIERAKIYQGKEDKFLLEDW